MELTIIVCTVTVCLAYSLVKLLWSNRVEYLMKTPEVEIRIIAPDDSVVTRLMGQTMGVSTK